MIEYCDGLKSLQILQKNSFKAISVAKQPNHQENYILKSYDKEELKNYVLLRQFIQGVKTKFSPIESPGIAKISTIIETDLAYEFICERYQGDLLQLQMARPQKVWSRKNAFLIVKKILQTLGSCCKDYIFSLSPEDVFYNQKSENNFMIMRDVDLSHYQFYLHEPTCQSFMKVSSSESSVLQK